MAHENNLTVGKGRLRFNRFTDGTKVGTGFRYLGNTPGFSLSQSEENLDHYDSDEGLKVKDESITLSQDTAGSITCDDISRENVALWFLGDATSVTVVAAEDESEVVVAKLGRTYILGVSDELPMGPGELTGVTVTKAGDPDPVEVTAAGNWEVDLDRGQITILDDAADIEDDDELTIGYDIVGGTANMVVSSNKSIYGGLYYEATNPKGVKRDAFFPYVKLAPDGDYDLKGDDWQTMTFSVEVLKLRVGTERVYWKDVG